MSRKFSIKNYFEKKEKLKLSRKYAINFEFASLILPVQKTLHDKFQHYMIGCEKLKSYKPNVHLLKSI